MSRAIRADMVTPNMIGANQRGTAGAMNIISASTPDNNPARMISRTDQAFRSSAFQFVTSFISVVVRTQAEAAPRTPDDDGSTVCTISYINAATTCTATAAAGGCAVKLGERTSACLIC